jgi:hypothetical protein
LAALLPFRIWLTVTPPMPTGEARAAMQLKGTQRFQEFVEVLGKRLQTGQSLLQEVMGDVDARPEARNE